LQFFQELKSSAASRVRMYSVECLRRKRTLSLILADGFIQVPGEDRRETIQFESSPCAVGSDIFQPGQ
jgi:hypothetical protein